MFHKKSKLIEISLQSNAISSHNGHHNVLIITRTKIKSIVMMMIVRIITVKKIL